MTIRYFGEKSKETDNHYLDTEEMRQRFEEEHLSDNITPNWDGEYFVAQVPEDDDEAFRQYYEDEIFNQIVDSYVSPENMEEEVEDILCLDFECEIVATFEEMGIYE